MKTIKLSVVLAVYNEEDDLGNCLESIETMADEIVVVDGGSTDKTVDIAKSFDAKIIQTNNPPNFHLNKNKAIEAAAGDWILQLDADEVVTVKLSQEIKKVISGNSDINGFWIPRSNYFLGKYLKKGGQYPDYTLRLYRKGKGRLPAKDVHEQAQVEGKKAYLINDLLHLSDKKFTNYMERFNKYTSLFASQLEQINMKINIFSWVNYFLIKPVAWFMKSYIRHRGYIDGFPGFIFALFSSLRFPLAYIKYCENLRRNKK